MLRIVPSGNSAAARNYYTSSLRREDYYTGELKVPAEWHGLSAEVLGVEGEVQTKEFTRLLENTHPLTGEKLTPRTRSDRLCGWDINFHCPKSFSILQAFTGDEDLVRVFREAVHETMADIEALAMTRVRKGGEYSDRVTGNLVWAEFVHSTARPVGGIPDPHLHVHCFVQNTTLDLVEERWKAVKIREIKKTAPYFQALFQARLAKKVNELGWATRRTRHAFEIVGLSEALLRKFSRRTAEIETLADEWGITDAKVKDSLGAKTRAGKRKGLNAIELLSAWGVRLHDDERVEIFRTHDEKPQPDKPNKITPAQAMAFAEGKCFERSSVVKRSQLLAAALHYGVGHIDEKGLERAMLRRGYIERIVDGELLCTRAVLMVEEAELIQKVREGRGRLAPMQPKRLRYKRDFLSREQKNAVRHILKSNDQVMLIRGVAGSGKTTLMQEVREQIEGTGLRVFAFAPSAAASRGVLQEEGFREADTVARLLVDEKLQRRTRGQVIFVDEAGLLGIRDLARIKAIAGQSTRVILVGDTKQHAPVARGDAMRLMEDYAGIPVASVRQIRRQEKIGYREAVKALSDGDTQKGFRLLEQLGAITEIEDDKARYRKLAEEYLRSMDESGVAPLVVSPTHAESRMVTRAIRDQLWEQGHLGEERPYLQYRPLKCEEAEKLRPENYSRGLAVQFHQNAKGIKRGSILQIVEVDGEKVWLGLPNGPRIELDWNTTDRFQIYERAEIKLAEGDLLKITRNGSSANGTRLYNGTVRRIRKIAIDGTLTLENGVKLTPEHGHIEHGYCHTSHSSQGKTVREVFVAQSSASFLAASKEGFYVSSSRAKETIRIFTDDRLELQAAIGNSSQRMSALEFGGIERDAFMSEGLNGVEWVKRVAAERARIHKPGATHVEKLAASRGVDPLKKPQSMDFRSYVEMRRANVGPDGKARSKGHGPSKAKKGSKGVTPPKRMEMKSSLKEKVTAKKETKATEVGRKSKVGRMLQTAKKNLKEKLEANLPAKSLKRGSKNVGVGNGQVKMKDLNGQAAQKQQVKRAVQQKRSEGVKKQVVKTQAPVIRKK